MLWTLWNVTGPLMVIGASLFIERSPRLNDRDKSVILLILFTFGLVMWVSSCAVPYRDHGDSSNVTVDHLKLTA